MLNETDSLRDDLIVFTDLDGTLLDDESYDFSAARKALEALRDNDVALVLASSKTAAEMEDLADRLPARPTALIVENGAGVVWPGSERSADRRHAALRAALEALPENLRTGFTGFTDWGPEGVARETGLPPADAARAAARDFSEPGLWQGSEADRAAFLEALEARGITARQGGRFLTLSFGADKADRMQEVAERIAPGAYRLALGDAPNDIAMLEAADLGIIIANPHGAQIDTLAGESTGRIRRSTLPGPAGWNAAVLETLGQIAARTHRR